MLRSLFDMAAAGSTYHLGTLVLLSNQTHVESLISPYLLVLLITITDDIFKGRRTVICEIEEGHSRKYVLLSNRNFIIYLLSWWQQTCYPHPGWIVPILATVHLVKNSWSEIPVAPGVHLICSDAGSKYTSLLHLVVSGWGFTKIVFNPLTPLHLIMF